MKKNRLFVLGILAMALLALGLGFVSCSNPVGTVPGVASYAEATEYVGDVNKVYQAASVVGGSRYYTGQIIDGKRFEANIVEYNLIRQSILDYVEALPSNNALMHQNYEAITFDASKKYVELATYTDVNTDLIVEIELRVFYGNFLDTYNTENWYAKSVKFNASFTKNLNTGESVNFD